jgi:hypothetical protein
MHWDPLPELRLPTPPTQPSDGHSLSVEEVFGIPRSTPMNYVFRETVDNALIEALRRRRHIVIHGSSKQGKTCMRKWNMKDDEYVSITCSNTWTMRDINVAILKAAGFTVSLSETRTHTGENKLTAKREVKLSILGAEGTAIDIEPNFLT